MRDFLITYKENKKYNDIEMRKLVTVSKPRDDIGYDAKAALGIFINSTGTLKKYEIISIQEMKDGNPIGEPIVPDNSIDTVVPIG